MFVELINSLNSSAYARFSKSARRFLAASSFSFSSALVVVPRGLRVAITDYPS
jgi:hypothetical protein